ncbi:MAG: xanthine dehydrogenase [Bryobacterales bacterium]|nr:xanthine dehydrogenase [Bryobacterales bacterium]
MRTARYVNDNLAAYLVPTEADVGEIEAILLHEDTDPSELMKLGELGIIGVNAAIANTVHHATGRRDPQSADPD